MDVGQILPIEEPLVVEGESQSSTQVEPSPPQDQQANQEQDEGPPSTEQDQGQDQPNDGGGAPIYDQDHVHDQGKAQEDEQYYGEAQDSEVDTQEECQEYIEEEISHRKVKIASNLQSQDHSLDQLLEA